MTRGIRTTADLYARSRIDPHDPCPYSPCWHWLGAKNSIKSPRIHTLDYDRVEKVCMSGPRAVLMLSRQAPLGNRIAYRTCCSAGCVNPAHHDAAKDWKEVGKAIAASGRLKGTQMEQRKANAEKARAAWRAARFRCPQAAKWARAA